MIESRIKQAAKKMEEPPESTMARFVDRAGQEDLIAVAYATVDSPFGTFVAAATDTGLVRLALSPYRTEDILEELARRLSPRVLEQPSKLDPVRRELDEYFAGKRFAFDLSVDWSLVTGFNERVLRATARIPYGSVTSYGTVAHDAGSPRAARAAGNALHNNPVPIVIPCHRVIGSGGSLVGYGGGLPMKEALLRMEGAI
jgi:methylated-DNA-[protein]-cysteine S-methyltransferase